MRGLFDTRLLLHVHGNIGCTRPHRARNVVNMNQRDSYRGSGGSTSSERARRVPPPPPPPPFSMPASSAGVPTLDRRQTIIGGGLLAVGVVAGLLSGGRMPSAEYERELSYVASQVGVRGMPSPVSAVVDKISGQIVGVTVIGKSGQEYLATVDPKKPSVLVLRAVGNTQATVRPGAVYRLPTRYDQINVANRRQIETIFRVPNWESMMY